MAEILDKIKGCMYGGAVGDALGYPVEFRSAREIFMKYGDEGIHKFELFKDKAYISDDTQMTLFTANGLLRGYTSLCLNGIMEPWENYVELAYKDWLMTQEGQYEYSAEGRNSWLLNYEEFYNNRAPGNTCLSALRLKECGSLSRRINNSKGCGGVMRVAPIGLYLPKHLDSLEEVALTGAKIAAITHTHPLGYIPAAALAHIIAKCATTDESLDEVVKDAINVTEDLFRDEKHIGEFSDIMKRAMELAMSDEDDLTAIKALGEGWVAEETLAISVYCALKYQNDFVKGVVAAVNHDGDSDSTGAVTGNILGAYLGIDGIPSEFITPLELKDVIEELSNDMYEDCRMSEYDSYRDEKWLQKYVSGQYCGRD
ncbi:MAG: ADP-ribosylglycohydrolase family protein [Lachnospiraceae bacterium]|nr:ADP-ribosylglycohydrolase family protein [Lachnospiraceae bacterium]